jgi:cytochrome c oxidase assembly factor CtaG
VNVPALLSDGTMGAQAMKGMRMGTEPPVDVHHVLFAWPSTPFGLAVGVALVLVAAWYGRATVLVGRRGRRWRQRRTAAFVAGLGSPVAVFANFTFVAHVFQHLLLMIAAPPLLALGAPMTLILQTCRRSTKVRILGVLHSRPFGILSHPVPVFCLYYLSMYAFFLTGALGYSMDHMWLMDLINLGFLGGATLFWWPMVGLDPILQWKMSPGFKLMNLMIGIPVESFLGIALLMSVHSAAPMYTLASTHTGGGVLWAATEFATILALAPIFVAWSRSDAREGQRSDARLDAGEVVTAPVMEGHGLAASFRAMKR